MNYNTLIAIFISFFTSFNVHAASVTGKPVHALAMYGEPKYAPDFAHFDYVNPNAPKGGEMRFSALGTFDSLNPFILKGVPAAGISMIYDTLLTESADEPFSKYGLLAETVEVAKNRQSVTFTLRPGGRWHDGTPITTEDVRYSFNLLVIEGTPFYRMYYKDVDRVETDGDHRITFYFKNSNNRELPLILGQFPILPKHYWEQEKNDFTKTTLTPPLGSGPYKIVELDPGKWIAYARVDDYWGKDLPVNRGRHNLHRLRYDYYRDATVAVEAFKAEEYDFRQENIAKNWATAYNIPQVEDGRIIKEAIPHEIPTGMQAFVFNTRLPKFSDPKVREAVAYAFDFEWTNANIFNGAYTRTESYFSNSQFAAKGLPGEAELVLLEPFHDQLDPRIFTETYHPPSTDGSGNNRENLIRAKELLEEAGWHIQDGKLIHTETGEVMEIEFLFASSTFERVTGPMIQNLRKLGITATMRTVDSAQYVERKEKYDYDIIVHVFGQSNSPGNEQKEYWHSAAADKPGGQNFAGIKNSAIDVLTEAVVSAETKKQLLAATHALDRALQFGFYVIPNWHVRYFRVLYWNKYDKPSTRPKYDLGLDTWWTKENAADNR